MMEFLVEFVLEVPAGTPHEEVERRTRAESAAAAELAEDGRLVRLWRRPLADWLRVTVTPLEAHPNDPAEAPR